VTRSSTAGGAGGVGVSIDYSGDPTTYATGGSGGNFQAGANGATGAANTGNGGGGAGCSGTTTFIGGAGGSGIVIIQYPSPVALATGGTITSFVKFGTTYQAHTYTTSGTFVTLTL
jgi:hypothetical protein